MTDEKRRLFWDFVESLHNADGGRNYKQEACDLTEAIIYLVTYAVNGGGFDQEQFNQTFAAQHRTLQQAMFNKILKLIHFMASDEYDTDGRNEHSKKIAQELDAVINGRAMPFI